MVQLLTLLFGLAALAVSFFSPGWAWGILAVPGGLLALTLWGLKQKKWVHIPELSDYANTLFQKFGHYYTAPITGGAYSAACSTVGLAGVAVAAVGALKAFWWGLAIAFGLYLAMGLLARMFNPVNFPIDEIEQIAHEEIISFMQGRAG